MGSQYDGSKDEIRALSAFINLMRAAESLGARQARRLKEHGLTMSQFGVLEALHHIGPLSQTELSAKLLKTGGDMTMVVDNLERRGLVKRARRRDDRRVVSVRLTAGGRRFIRRLMPGQAKEIVGDMDRLSASEQAALRRMCRRLGKQED